MAEDGKSTVRAVERPLFVALFYESARMGDDGARRAGRTAQEHGASHVGDA